MKTLKQILAALTLGLALVVILGLRCHRIAGPGGTPQPTQVYRIDGVAVRDMNSTDQVWLRVRRSGALFDSATVLFDTVAVPRIASGEYQRLSPGVNLTPGNHTLAVRYAPDNLNLSLALVMPDTFVIDSSSLDATERQYRGIPATVTLDWSPSVNAQGYLVAANRETPVRDNFQSFLQLSVGANSFGFPRNTWRDTLADTVLTGLYRIHVASYRPTLVSYPGMPFVLPALGLSDNINSPNLTGRFGASVIAPFDTIRVITQF